MSTFWLMTSTGWVFSLFVSLSFFSAALAWRLRGSPESAILFFWSMLSGIFVAIFPGASPFYDYDPVMLGRLSSHCFVSCLILAMLSVIANNRFLKFFIVAAIIDAIVMPFHKGFFLMNNHSIDACFLVCFLQFFSLGIGLLIFLLVIALSKSVTAISAVAIVLIVESLRRRGVHTLLLSIPFVAIVFVVCQFYMAHFHVGGVAQFSNSISDDHGRFYLWSIVGRYWIEHFSFWIGSGTGTFYTWAPTIQKGNSFFFWLHNDWFQILVENGFIGFSLAVTAYFRCLWRLRHSKWFTSFIVFGYIAFTQPILENPIFALFGACLLKTSIEE